MASLKDIMSLYLPLGAERLPLGSIALITLTNDFYPYAYPLKVVRIANGDTVSLPLTAMQYESDKKYGAAQKKERIPAEAFMKRVRQLYLRQFAAQAGFVYLPKDGVAINPATVVFAGGKAQSDEAGKTVLRFEDAAAGRVLTYPVASSLLAIKRAVTRVLKKGPPVAVFHDNGTEMTRGLYRFAANPDKTYLFTKGPWPQRLPTQTYTPDF